MFVRNYEYGFMEYSDYVAHKVLLLYVPPVLLLIGTFGNLFAFGILLKNVRKASTYTYLIALAVMDLLVLYVGLLRLWIGQFATELEDMSNVMCKGIIFLGYVCSDTSVWLIVLVTIERTVVVMFPLQATRICNVRYARIGIACLVVIFILINFHFFFSVEINTRTFNDTVMTRCQSTPYHEFLVEDVWPWVDAALYSFLPFVMILILNSLIIKQILTARKTRNALRQQSSLFKRNGTSRNDKSQDEMSKKLTCMLLSVSFTFLMTTLPMNLIIIYKSVTNGSEDNGTFATMKLLSTIAELLMYTNHSVNFFLYCATGRKFRTQFKSIICCCWSSSVFRNFRWNSQRSAGSVRMYKLNSTTGMRSVYLDCEPMHLRGTPM